MDNQSVDFFSNFYLVMCEHILDNVGNYRATFFTIKSVHKT